VARWAAGEALAFAGWTGLLVYAGALLTDAYRISPGTTGLLLGLAALAHLAGNVVARRWLASAARTTVVLVLPAMAVTAVLLCAVRPSPAFSVTIFAVCCFLGGARTIAVSALGLSLGGTARLRAMGLRTAAVQFGYLLGAGLGGLGLALAGWPGLGMALGGLLLLATLAYPG
jgi:predicted MFS family arabinose efflux permease